MKFNAAMDHIIRLYRAGLRQTVFFSGPPGIGKSACPIAAADILRREWPSFQTLIWPMTSIDPLDLGGMPAVLDAGSGPYAARLPFAEIIPAEGCGFLVLDDITAAPPLTQAAAYRLVYERQIGNRRLGDGWAIICTGNRDQDRAATNRMPTPLVSKMGWIEFEPDLEGWLDRMAINDGDPIVRAFLQSCDPALFVNFDPMRPGPYATARTWESASELMQAYSPDMPPYEALRGWIGDSAAIQFNAFATMAAQLVSPDVVLMSPETAPIPEDPGALYVITTTLASKATAGNFDRICTYIDRLPQEFAIYCVKSAVKTDQGRMKALPEDQQSKYRLIAKTGAFTQFISKNHELMN